tara:strand:+ start:17936 stop:18562 length:627 start_codon:yes stop_codon:yes gene_type:complete
MSELHIQERTTQEKAESIRAAGKIPAVFYGPKEESTPITVDERDFIRLWNEVGSATIIDLKGVGDDKEVLISDVTWHPVLGTPLHVDFYCIERGKKLTVSVPLTFEGEAPAEKLGGVVTKVMHELEIEVRPRDIPTEIRVDLTQLVDLNSTITIADLHLSEEINPTAEPTEAVASIAQQQEEPEEEERSIEDVVVEGEQQEEEEETEA